ncbi:MAG: hypothetical protein QGI60_04115 [archaeon]|jgi:hypothetical protein|nr:hypothetical protein [archaeon]
MAKRKRLDGIKVTLGRPALLGGGHLAPFPYLKISRGKSRLVGLPAWVLLKNKFGGEFKTRAKVLRLHLMGKDPRVAVNLFNELQALESKMKAKGFKGMYADTANKAIVKGLERHGWTTMPTPRVTDFLIRLLVEEAKPRSINHFTRVIKRFETE